MAGSLVPTGLRIRPLLRHGVTSAWVWAPDGAAIWYYHRPSADTAGTWAVNVTTGLASRLTPIWGDFTRSGRLAFVWNPQAQATTIHELASGASWNLAPSAPDLVADADERRIAYSVMVPGADPSFVRPARLYVADLDGSGRTLVGKLIGGVTNWTSRGELLSVGREALDAPTMARIVGLDGTVQAQWPLGKHVQSARLSPHGRFLAYTSAFDAPDSTGPYVLDLRSGVRRALPLEGSVRWLADERGLLVIPMRRRTSDAFQVHHISIDDLTVEPFTDPHAHPIDLEFFDWKLDPTGSALAYRQARTGELRVLRWGRTTGDPDDLERLLRFDRPGDTTS
ncbi:MAG: hypothetical protein FJ029_14200 [Actinobacteria bacterium]|nr:hypothetical protein [Actinomycetota bacterium]